MKVTSLLCFFDNVAKTGAILFFCWCVFDAIVLIGNFVDNHMRLVRLEQQHAFEIQDLSDELKVLRKYCPIPETGK